ncbi:chaperone modulator CbpM [Variovorax sp. OV329]|uniref:chaperone modulator CbpM n=1 Tax=Variovorax sp. OV329 TaxID=1882825 RepID=UPI0008EEB371|nr:chaperone modulator CbpM [Variovorax sp. OV329]SFL86287.1 chaperone modulatory protein CbpM [Variovorax sp. OV329]
MVTIKSSYTVTAISDAQPLAAHELAHACGAELDWVIQLVDVGIVEADGSERPPQEWRFQSAALQCALEARRLERDFGASLDAAALIIDLEREVRRLKALLGAQAIHAR